MSRFFIKPENILDHQVRLEPEELKHMKSVLRIKPGEHIVLCDGEGTDYLFEVGEFGREVLTGRLLHSTKNRTEPHLSLTLYQGIPKSDKMELIIQKSVELGVKRIVPVITDRTVVRFEGKEDASRKQMRWQKVSHEAAKQSGRGIIPEVAFPLKFTEAVLQAAQDEIRIIPYENEAKRCLKEALIGKNKYKASIFIGPEGGFSQEEIAHAVKTGVQPVTLGSRILRTETAGIVVIAVCMYELGEMKT